jgi:hypothetical protein
MSRNILIAPSIFGQIFLTMKVNILPKTLIGVLQSMAMSQRMMCLMIYLSLKAMLCEPNIPRCKPVS